ncbi:MAG: ABC transporter permease [Gemmatimonadota bacterium]|nr:ABC transporter permease [Gemmatimonadota bacterium]
MSNVIFEIRAAARALRKSPGFTSVAVLSLGVALGLTTIMFGLVDAAIHPYAPYREPERLFSLQQWGYDRTGKVPTPGALLLLLKRDGKFHAGLALSTQRRTTVETGTEGREVGTAFVTPDFFSVFGVAPALGRTWATPDGIAADESQAVVSERLWKQIGGTKETVGRLTVRANERVFTVIGVMPRAMNAPPLGDQNGTELWLPIPVGHGDSTAFNLRATFRLAPGATAASASRALDQFSAQLSAEYGDAAKNIFYRAKPVWVPVSGYNSIHLALGGAVVIVMLIACANLSQLVLGRGLARRRELAIRSALGAPRGALLKHTMLECGWIALGGAALGVLLAVWGSGIVGAAIPTSVRNIGLVEPHLSWRVFAIGLSAALATIMIFALGPAIRASRADPGDAMKDGAGSTTGRNEHRYSALVIAEVALSMVLLVGAGLLIKSADTLLAFDFGYDPKHIVQASIPMYRVTQSDSAAGVFLANLISRSNALPGVRASTLIYAGGGVDHFTMTYEDAGAGMTERFIGSGYNEVTPNFLRTLGIGVIRGRDFEEGDASAGAVIISNQAAKQLWPFGDAIGKVIKFGPRASNRPLLRIVGITRDAFLNVGDVGADSPALFFAVPPASVHHRFAQLVVRGSGSTGALSVALRRQLIALSPAIGTASYITPWSDQLSAMIERDHFLTTLFGVFSGFGLLVSAVGLYGVIAYAVTQRMREFALRVALGAEQRDVAKLVLHDGAVMLLAGTGIGAFVAMFLTRATRNLVFGLDTYDPMALIAAEAILFAIGLVACFVPARRAMRANPLDVLRAM